MSKSLNEWGRFLALVLRHKPQAVGIELDVHGWAQVEALLAAFNRIEAFNMLMLKQIVAEDDKQRFAFSEDKKRIRANQGHSVKVDVELREAVPPELLYHGTGVKYVASINRQGLIAKQRLYVHLSANVETAHNVGKRHGEPFIYTVLAGEMARAGYKFYLSANGVWLTESVPKKFLWEWRNDGYENIIIDAWCAGLRQEHVYKGTGAGALYIERGCIAPIICFADAG